MFSGYILPEWKYRKNIIRLLQIKYQIAQKNKIFVITNNNSKLQATVKKNTSDTSNHITLQANRNRNNMP